MTMVTRVLCSWSTLACLVLLAVTAPAAAMGVKNGVTDPTGPDPVTHTGPRAASVVGEVVVNFDDAPAPCVFIETVPLRDAYLPFGVRFSGPDALGGGAVLNACSSFDVFGYSGDNFLAFNEFASCSNGGVPATPETIDFTSQVSAVSMLVGSADNAGATVSLDAFDATNALVGANTRVINPGLQPIGVSGIGIVRVVLKGPSFLVVDDLRFTPGGAVGVASHSWGRLKALYR